MSAVALTPELERQILAGIRAGGYPHVAAAAFGVPHRTFAGWLRAGRRRDAEEPYAGFARRVEEAQGQARLHAELAAFQDDPRTWLKHGPGRERPGRPGWSTLARPHVKQAAHKVDLFAATAFLNVLAEMRSALTSFPEALDAWTRTLDRLERTSWN